MHRKACALPLTCGAARRKPPGQSWSTARDSGPQSFEVEHHEVEHHDVEFTTRQSARLLFHSNCQRAIRLEAMKTNDTQVPESKFEILIMTMTTKASALQLLSTSAVRSRAIALVALSPAASMTSKTPTSTIASIDSRASGKRPMVAIRSSQNL